MWKYLSIVFFVFMLVGCDQTVATKVKTSEIFNQSEQQWFEAKIIFEIPSEQEFIKSKSYLKETFEKYFLSVESVEYLQKGFSSLACVNIHVPIIHQDSLVNSLYYFELIDGVLYVELNKDFYESFKRDIESVYSIAKVDLSNVTCMLLMNNDLNESLNVTILPSYIGTEPFLFNKEIEFKYNDQMIITCSNLSMSYLEKNNSLPLLFFK